MVKLYVEGGGDSKALKSECRRAFREFLEKSGLKNQMPAIAASGSRRFAYDDFCMALASGQVALLLVDSEAPVAPAHQAAKQAANWRPWLHLKHRQGDGWHKPTGAKDADCHLMVECMESWLLADRETLKGYFGQGFQESALPAAEKSVESIRKADVMAALKHATRGCKTKGEYGKGAHSFDLLARIDPAKVLAASPWAQRWVDEVKARMNA